MDFKVKQNWQHFFNQYLKSGMSKTEFCRSQKVAPSRFFYYANLHREPAPAPNDKSGPFVQLAGKKDFTIRINNSVSLTFDSVPDACWMANFVKSMGEAHANT
ncbi:MAG: hypothetical protein H0U49_02225 [Parachlamydiaceae bacterium]|nr:hypothetical protein [Parachlamydiaceae bacterium]